MNKRPQTHEELMGLFVESIEGILKDIKTKQKELKKTKDFSDVTKLHYTTRQIQSWFRRTGGLPIPE
jgi:hypothetical protein